VTRVLVTGSRQWRDIETVDKVLSTFPPGTTIVHGCASGLDAIARSVAIRLGLVVEDHWPDYRPGKNFTAATLARNEEMVRSGIDEVLVFPTGTWGTWGTSRGTWFTYQLAQKLGISTKVYREGSDLPVKDP